MIVHVYKHNTTPYLSDTAGFWAAIDETGKYRGQRYTLQEWEIAHNTLLRQGMHHDKCPPQISSLKNYRIRNNKVEYSVYWFDTAIR